jgi:hypothetical protein
VARKANTIDQTDSWASTEGQQLAAHDRAPTPTKLIWHSETSPP